MAQNSDSVLEQTLMVRKIIQEVRQVGGGEGRMQGIPGVGRDVPRRGFAPFVVFI
jgi:hypothetical protein